MIPTTPSDAVEPIWACLHSDDYSNLGLFLLGNRRWDGVTTTELCRKILSLTEIKSGVYEVNFMKMKTDDSATITEIDLLAIGRKLHSMPGLTMLRINGCWTDMQVQLILNYMLKTNIHFLELKFDEKKGIPNTLNALKQSACFPFLLGFYLEYSELDEVDCQTLGKLLESRQPGEVYYIDIKNCTFPSLSGFLEVSDALIETGPFIPHLADNTVKDATIHSPPGLLIPNLHKSFFKILDQEDNQDDNEYVEEDNQEDETEEEEEDLDEDQEDVDEDEKDENDASRFDNAARKYLYFYSYLNRAGRLTLLNAENQHKIGMWVEAICDENVRENVGCIFHFLSMNPSIYVKAACSQTGGDTDNIQD